MPFTKHKNKHQQGQALLFVVVAVTIALSVGVAVSSRSLFMSSRTSRTDTSSRVFAAAEGGAEQLLNQPESFLDTLVADSGLNCGDAGMESASESGKCLYVYQNTDDPVSSQAVVDADTFKTNSPEGQPAHYWFDLNSGDVKEVRLQGFGSSSIQLCWDNPQTAIYYVSYNSSGTVKRAGLRASSGFGHAGDVSAFDAVSGGSNGYPLCKTVDLVSNVMGLRIKPLYEPAKIAVFSNNLPTQGYKITSRGELVQEGQVKTSETITVYRSYPYLPSTFDYAVYSNAALD